MDKPIITRKEAKALGLTRYFTGKACAHGHTAERMTGNGECVECKRLALLSWRDGNRDKVLAQKRRWYERNSDAILAAHKEAYAANPEPKKARTNAWRKANPEMHREKNNAWRVVNRKKDRAYSSVWRAANKDYIKAKSREWRLSNPDKHVAKEQRRRAKKRAAIPSWYGEFDEFAFQEAADLAKRREAVFGFSWHIDHMIPLAARNACGLHVAENIAVIPHSINVSKQNKMIYTEPGSWLRAA